MKKKLALIAISCFALLAVSSIAAYADNVLLPVVSKGYWGGGYKPNGNYALFNTSLCPAGSSGGNPFDQSLNTTDSPTFTDLHLQTEISTFECAGTWTSCEDYTAESNYEERELSEEICSLAGCGWDSENCTGTTEQSCFDYFDQEGQCDIMSECTSEGGTEWQNYFELNPNPFETGGAYTENPFTILNTLTASDGVFLYSLMIGDDNVCSGECLSEGDQIYTGLSGSGNAYACLDENGVLFRSDTPCIV